MIEIGALVLSIGALLYRTMEFQLFDIGMIAAGIVIVSYIWTRSLKGMFAGLLLGGVLMLGALALWRVDTPVPKTVFGKRAFDARVVSVDRRLERTLIVVREEKHKLQLSLSGSVPYLPGDHVTVRGSVVLPEDFATDTGRIFEYKAYLASKGIVAMIDNPTVVLVEEGKWSFARTATIIRYGVADIFARHVRFPFDGVISGMLVGYQGGLPASVQHLFRDTGVLHVLVLSGYNITLLAGFLAILLRGLPFRLHNGITIGAIILLVLVSGAGVAAVRAGIMGSTAVLAGLSLRTYQPLRALCIAYLFFFFVSPTSVFVDPGFHLSFLATLFMVLVLPKVEQVFSFIPTTRHVDVRELLMLAFTVPVFMLPYLMYFSGTFPVVSPLANILLALATPIIMVMGIIVLALSWTGPIVGMLGTVISWGGSGLLWLLELCAKLPIWQTPELPWWGVAGIYGLLLFVLFRQEINSYLVQLRSVLRLQSNSDS